ncbi:hypothetical protein GCM10011360_19060 [Primorskyibacter flagellatus]|uniref:Uncharacterized protein n=1 Tax=Primorskyibacter flagellatus TaxID=1387277 RepID=A0A917EF10_9RHOB|nr:hypothetical protein [Primorskyibacter flagellatus]GGE31312.1 hypothetical protein GCM10011360_19060 [Primorskyibacter flagellatus]
MSDFFAFLFSPAGLVAYGAFWVVKIIAGAWAIRQILTLLPERTRGWTEYQLTRIGLLRRKGPLG